MPNSSPVWAQEDFLSSQHKNRSTALLLQVPLIYQAHRLQKHPRLSLLQRKAAVVPPVARPSAVTQRQADPLSASLLSHRGPASPGARATGGGCLMSSNLSGCEGGEARDTKRCGSPGERYRAKQQLVSSSLPPHSLPAPRESLRLNAAPLSPFAAVSPLSELLDLRLLSKQPPALHG